MLSRTSLSDGTGVDGGSHGAEGKDGRSRREIELRPYKVGEGRIADICVIWGHRQERDSLPLKFGWPSRRIYWWKTTTCVRVLATKRKD